MSIEFPPVIEKRSITPDCDILVIGAGFAGSCAASQLAVDFPEARIVLAEGNALEGFVHDNRAEMVVFDRFKRLGLEESATAPLSNVAFYCPGNGREIMSWSSPLKDLNALGQDLVMAVDRQVFMSELHRRVIDNPAITVADGDLVVGLDEDEHQDGVWIKFKSGREVFSRIVVDSSGPSLGPLLMPDARQQIQFENSIVAVNYGRRCRGRINVEGGEEMLLLIPGGETGRTSWVNSCGNDKVELVFSDYALRREARNNDRIRTGFREPYQKLKSMLVKTGIVELFEEGPEIYGCYSLEPSRVRPKSGRIIPFGERSCLGSPVLGEHLQPIIDMLPSLAEAVTSKERVATFWKRSRRFYPYPFELALTRARYKAPCAGKALSMFNVVDRMSAEEQRKTVSSHRPPFRHLPCLFLKHPELFRTLGEVAVQYLKLLAEDFAFRLG